MASVTEVGDLGAGVRARTDAVIDVRSPSEFAEDHAPGAINLPVLSDEERARVGTIYVQDDTFLARRLGAALVARNIALHLEGALAGHGGGWRPLVYCWRGGQRSHAMATVLAQVGWRTSLLTGGYKTYRRQVVRALYDATPPADVVLLGGATGVGKTELLERLGRRGVQVIDLEGLAEHRGSLLGALPGCTQPSQKRFESRLAEALAAVDPARPLVLEAESSRIGDLSLPPVLWAAMGAAPTVELTAPAQARTARLVATYREGAQDAAGFAERLGRLPRHIPRASVARWRELLARDELEVVAGEVAAQHYDPAYARTARLRDRPALGEVSTGTGSDADLERAADRVCARLAERDADRTAPSPAQPEAVPADVRSGP